MAQNNNDLLRFFINKSLPLPSIPDLSSTYLPDITPPATLNHLPKPLATILQPTKIRISPLRNMAENRLKSELADIITQRLDKTLARIVPSLDDITFGDGKEISLAVLYTDIRNSSSITNSHIAENAAKIYKVFYTSMIFAAERYKGKIGGFAGDRIMIVFPFKTGDSPRAKAIKTAIYMHYLLQQYVNPALNNNKFQHTLDCGIGIDFGEVLVVKVGKYGTGNNDRIWTGHVANYASKLSDLDTGIYVSNEVYTGLNDPSLKTKSWVRLQDNNENYYYKYTDLYTPL